MRWHRFNQEEDRRKNDDPIDWEIVRWTSVMPGDVVQSRGTRAWRLEDLYDRHVKGTKIYTLHSSPVLVLSRIPGIPGEEHDADFEEEYVTFVCLSRHGLIAVIGDLKIGR
jgi:hypothetical protein